MEIVPRSKIDFGHSEYDVCYRHLVDHLGEGVFCYDASDKENLVSAIVRRLKKDQRLDLRVSAVLGKNEGRKGYYICLIAVSPSVN